MPRLLLLAHASPTADRVAPPDIRSPHLAAVFTTFTAAQLLFLRQLSSLVMKFTGYSLRLGLAAFTPNAVTFCGCLFNFGLARTHLIR